MSRKGKSPFDQQLDDAQREHFFRRVDGTDGIYLPEDMLKMFRPYLVDGNEKGLSAREIKLINTVEKLREELDLTHIKTEAIKKWFSIWGNVDSPQQIQAPNALDDLEEILKVQND